MKARRLPGFLDELHQKKDSKEQEIQSVASITQDMLGGHNLILSSNDILRKLRKEGGADVKLHRLRKILNQDLGLQYKKIKKVPLHANSSRSLILRQKFARSLLENAQKGSRILNVDETWIGESDFRRMSWSSPG